MPVNIGITVNYDHRSQAVLYSHARRWELGLKLFIGDLELLTSEGSPYEKLRVMVHLDHVQPEYNEDFLNRWDMTRFSSIRDFSFTRKGILLWTHPGSTG